MENEYKDPYKPLELHKLKKNKHVGIHCPKCDTATPADNLNIQDKIGKCSSCDSVFSFENTLVSLAPLDATPDLKRPQGIDFIELNDEIEFSLTPPYSVWHSISGFVFPLVVAGLIGIYFDKGYISLLYYAGAFSAISLYSIYRLIRTKYEKIYVTIDKNDLHIIRRPDNANSDKKFSIVEIEQVYIKLDPNGGWALHMVLNKVDGQKHVKLIERFTDYSKAKYLEQEIERYLGIENRKVIGEV